jgi:kinesin family protein 18/19
MISNISPSVSAFEETYNTLVYANRAKNIKTVANRNVLNAQNHISNYAEMIKNLRQENEELKHLIQNNN